MDSTPATLNDLSPSLTPLPSVADSNDVVDRLPAVPATPERSLTNDFADEESDLSPLTSSDKEEDINVAPYPIRSGRALRPRVVKVSTYTAESTTSTSEITSLPSPPSLTNQRSRTSKKRKRAASPAISTVPTAQEQRPKPSAYVSKERCHQCRNQPRHAFMRCASKDDPGKPCRKLFCVSCITKRYPDDIDFDPRLEKWRCPFCKDACNCTKCCSKRNETYTSTSGVKIDHETLLYYASLMPDNSNSQKRSPSLPKSLKRASKNLRFPNNSKPIRGLAKNKPGAGPPEKAQKKGSTLEAARDIEPIIRGLSDTATMFEKFGCVSGEYWGTVFSNVDGGRIGVAYVGDQLPDIFMLEDREEGALVDEPLSPSKKRLRMSSRVSA